MKKYLLTTLLILALGMTLAACGKDGKVDGNEEVSSGAQVQEDTADDVVNEETTTSEDSETDTKVSDEETITDNEEVNVSDEPAVEMVDFETWATQADNDEVCMVVWNEKTGTQKILEQRPANTLDVENYSYTVQEGDRFAVPKRNSIICVYINLDTRLEWDYSSNEKYMELEINPGEITQIDIILNIESMPTAEYLFNF